jgi:putative endonuclease
MPIFNWIFFWRKTESLGDRGERLAAGFLKRAGMTVIGTNIQCGKGELDIVAMEGDVLVIAEVRARADENFMRVEETVNWKKRKSLRKAAKVYVRRRKLYDMQVRFDVIAIVGEAGKEEIRHHKHAFGWRD